MAVTKVFTKIALSVGVVLTIATTSGTKGEAQSNRVARRGGPHDWSHGRLIASRFGRSLDRKIDGDWRTWAKQQRLANAKAMQNSPIVNWFDLLSQAFAPKKPQPAAEHLDWNLRTGGTGAVVGTPAKYSWDISASNCADVIYYTVDQAGVNNVAPNVIAITNPYAGCSGNAAGTTPTVKWAIALPTGTATSPVPSLDGTVLYVLEKGTAGVILHAINVNNITSQTGTYNFGTSNWNTTHTLSTTGMGTSGEQLFQLTFSGVTNNVSSPYLDYSTNQIFFGDSGGRIRHVVNANLASASIDTTRFTNTCGTSQLQSPVFVNGQVITTSANGRIYRMDTTGLSPYTCVASTQAGSGVGADGGVSAPVIDVENGAIIIVSNDGAGFGVAGVGTFDLMFGSGGSWTSAAQIGNNANNIAPVSPAFDDAFWSTNNGNLYVVGNRQSATDTYLIRVPYNGSIGTPAGYAQLHRSGGLGALVNTSPVTEFLTASSLTNKDFIYVGGAGNTGGTTTYYFMNRIRAGFSGTDTTPVTMDNWFQPANGLGVTSGISIDTRTTAMTGTTATANIYFGTIGVTGTQSQIIQLAQQF